MSLPGAPIILYGDELGMGDMLSLPDRGAVRTAMQWSGDRNAGFCDADADADVDPQVPLQRDGPYASRRVNVGQQRSDDGSLLNWIAAAIRTRRESSAIGWRTAQALQVYDPRVFGVRHDHHTDAVIALSNLADEPVEVTISDCGDVRRVEEVFADQDYREAKTLEEPLAIEQGCFRDSSRFPASMPFRSGASASLPRTRLQANAALRHGLRAAASARESGLASVASRISAGSSHSRGSVGHRGALAAPAAAGLRRTTDRIHGDARWSATTAGRRLIPT
jgi:hypothetical protein